MMILELTSNIVTSLNLKNLVALDPQYSPISNQVFSLGFSLGFNHVMMYCLI